MCHINLWYFLGFRNILYFELLLSYDQIIRNDLSAGKDGISRRAGFAVENYKFWCTNFQYTHRHTSTTSGKYWSMEKIASYKDLSKQAERHS